MKKGVHYLLLALRMSKSEQLKSFIKDNISYFEGIGGAWDIVEAPIFELYARDYLKFAQEELEKKTVVSLINCVSHLKRATDCQIDTFFPFTIFMIYSIDEI